MAESRTQAEKKTSQDLIPYYSMDDLSFFHFLQAKKADITRIEINRLEQSREKVKDLFKELDACLAKRDPTIEETRKGLQYLKTLFYAGWFELGIKLGDISAEKRTTYSAMPNDPSKMSSIETDGAIRHERDLLAHEDKCKALEYYSSAAMFSTDTKTVDEANKKIKAKIASWVYYNAVESYYKGILVRGDRSDTSNPLTRFRTAKAKAIRWDVYQPWLLEIYKSVDATQAEKKQALEEAIALGLPEAYYLRWKSQSTAERESLQEEFSRFLKSQSNTLKDLIKASNLGWFEAQVDLLKIKVAKINSIVDENVINQDKIQTIQRHTESSFALLCKITTNERKYFTEHSEQLLNDVITQKAKLLELLEKLKKNVGEKLEQEYERRQTTSVESAVNPKKQVIAQVKSLNKELLQKNSRLEELLEASQAREANLKKENDALKAENDLLKKPPPPTTVSRPRNNSPFK